MNGSNLVKFVRELLNELHPSGCRIELIEMVNEPFAVPPGTKGTLHHIDDAGHFHMEWDNGRTISLIPGVDKFKVYDTEKDMIRMKFYMPVSVSVHNPPVEWWVDNEDDEDDGIEDLSATEAVQYASFIQFAMEQYKQKYDLREIDCSDVAGGKAKSFEISIEKRKFKDNPSKWILLAVASCLVIPGMSEAELQELKDDIEGQMSDGFGEAFEQHEIEGPNNKSLYAHLWSNKDLSGMEWFLKSEEEIREIII